MSKAEFNPIKDIQQLIDSAVNGTGEDLDLSMAPPFVRGMDLTGLQFIQVGIGEFDMVWTIDPHLTHYDGMVPMQLPAPARKHFPLLNSPHGFFAQ